MGGGGCHGCPQHSYKIAKGSGWPQPFAGPPCVKHSGQSLLSTLGHEGTWRRTHTAPQAPILKDLDILTLRNQT